MQRGFLSTEKMDPHSNSEMQDGIKGEKMVCMCININKYDWKILISFWYKIQDYKSVKSESGDQGGGKWS